MNLLYIIAGENPGFHIQATFSIYSFLTQRHAIRSINIITDSPGYYKHLENFVNILPVDKDTFDSWKGKQDFFWRIKIKGIEMICNLYPGSPVIYLDTDTFLYRRIEQLQGILMEGKALMHERETTLAMAKSKTEKRMWAGVRNKVFGSVTVSPAHYMWNAGVVAFPNTKGAAEIRLALDICDEMCAAGITRRLIEQFALSVALAEVYKIEEARNFIGHYWSNKDEWNKAISSFFLVSYLNGYTPEKNIALIKEFNFNLFPVNRKTKSIIKRTELWLSQIFPDKTKYLLD